jgi:Flp pilus assembly protein TadD
MAETVRTRPKEPRREWQRAAFALPVAVCIAVLVSGCQTSEMLDSAGMRGTAVASGDISEADLAQGKSHFMNGNYGLAEKHFRKAVELRADNAEAWLGLAASYDRLGRFDFADRAYDQLINVAGRQPRIVNNMGYSQYLRGNRKKARMLLLEARAALPGDPLIEANLVLLESG